ncbi:phosphotransferase [Actinopolymorpha sp. NPDC004070]|uniref:phosphotransferase n=1 Tax=Actinopolymorpha sp. NPDC004070 TaxID=3154548 RepID=UPI0033A69AFE
MTAGQVAEAFDLGTPTGELVLVQHTVSRTWRMTTSAGRFLVKELWPDEDPPWADELVRTRELEERAAAAGIRTPRPVPPPTQAYGWTSRVAGRGAYRVTEWVEHRKVSAADDLTDWLGRTLAVLHSLELYAGDAGDLEPFYYVHPAGRWHEWAARARRQGRPWATTFDERLDGYLHQTERLRTTYSAIGDHVLTHRDIVPFNVLMTPTGPVLTDWDVIGPDSASLETGFAAVTFAFRDPRSVRHTLASYAAHGGTLVGALGENLFAHKLGSELGLLAVLVDTVVTGTSLTGWMTRYADADEGVVQSMEEVAAAEHRLRRLAADLGVGARLGS